VKAFFIGREKIVILSALSKELSFHAMTDDTRLGKTPRALREQFNSHHHCTLSETGTM